MMTTDSQRRINHAQQIAEITADEAFQLLTTEVERLLDLARSLDPDDWQQPTACTQWTVRDILAHQAGGYASGTGYREMLRQYIPAMLARTRLPEDVLNANQIRERAGNTPSELIEEIAQAGPVAARQWAYGFAALRPIVFPHPVAGIRPLRDLFWIIHSRDTWMHRLDICRATQRAFHQTAGHDGRIVELIVQDAEQALRRRLAGQAVEIHLTGRAGGSWIIGKGRPAAAIQMDALDFAIYASGRFSPQEAQARAEWSGDKRLSDMVFNHLLILF